MRGLGIGDVAYSLKLNPRQVEALEAERFDLLPGRAFARGFLKNYARFLELDPQPLLDAAEHADGVGAMELSPVCNAQGTMPSPDARLRPSIFPAALVAVGLLVVVAAGWYFDWFQQPEIATETAVEGPVAEGPAFQAPVTAPPLEGVTTPVEVLPAQPPVAKVVGPGLSLAAPQLEVLVPAGQDGGQQDTLAPAASPPKEGDGALPEGARDAAPAEVAAPPAAAMATKPEGASTPAGASTSASAPQAEIAPTAAAEAAAPQADARQSLVFRFAEDAWVEVRDGSGRIIMSRIGQAGSVEKLQGKPPFALVIGNAAKVTLEHQGQAEDLAPHTRVSVARLKLE